MPSAWWLIAAQLAVLPVRRPADVDAASVELFVERLLVALDEAGVEAIAAPDGTGVDQTLSVRLLVEDGDLRAFVALEDTRDASVVKRHELRAADLDELAKLAPAEIAAWVVAEPQEAEAQPPLVGLVAPMDPPGYAVATTMTTRLAGALASSTTVAVGAKDARYRGELVIDDLTIEVRRHHVRKYLDGKMTATLTLVDTREGTTVFSSQVTATVSRRAKRTTHEAVAAELAATVVSKWNAAFHASAPNLEGGTP